MKRKSLDRHRPWLELFHETLRYQAPRSSRGKAPCRQSLPAAVPTRSTRGRSRPAEGSSAGAWVLWVSQPAGAGSCHCGCPWPGLKSGRGADSQPSLPLPQVGSGSSTSSWEQIPNRSKSWGFPKLGCSDRRRKQAVQEGLQQPLSSPLLQPQIGLRWISSLPPQSHSWQRQRGGTEPCQPWGARNKHAWEKTRYTSSQGTDTGRAGSSLERQGGKQR